MPNTWCASHEGWYDRCVLEPHKASSHARDRSTATRQIRLELTRMCCLTVVAGITWNGAADSTPTGSSYGVT